MLSCGTDVVGFTEGSSSVNLSALLVLSDADSNHEVSMGSVFIENPKPGDAIALVESGSLRVVLVSDTEVLVDGVGTVMQYQVRTSAHFYFLLNDSVYRIMHSHFPHK